MGSIGQECAGHTRLCTHGEGDGRREPVEGKSGARPWYGGGDSRGNQREGLGIQKD